MLKKILLLVLLIIASVLIYKPAQGLATSFENTYLRLDSQSASSPLSGTICAEPSSSGAGTENKLAVVFPSDFTISSNTSNWTTNTSDLPSGSTAWPGISVNATVVAGKSVTFSSSDLTSNSLYCFRFNAASSTTGSAGNDKTGTIITKNSSDGIIDLTTYALSILTSNQITITASVDPALSELPISIESLTPGTQFPQDSTISYRITYGSNASTSIPLIIEAQWSQGTIQGSPTPSVDILDYVIGSATDAYSSTPPVIDTINRTITWTISSFPAATTGETVTFSLKTNDSYTGSNLVDFDVSARAISGSVVTPDETVTLSYLYSASGVTPTPTSAPSASITPTPGAAVITPTPVSVLEESLLFEDISIRSVSKDDAKIAVITNKDALLTISYGKALNNLSERIKTLIYQDQNLLSVSGLEPDTDYFFTITAIDKKGNTITSDIFTFKTALISVIPRVNQQSLLVTSNDNVLFNALQFLVENKLKTNIVVIPRSTVISVQFVLDRVVSLKSIKAIIRNKGVLGFTTIENPDASVNFIDLVETQPGVYTGKMASSPSSGEYEVYVRMIDYNGNILEEKIMDLKVISPFIVLRKDTSEPIENARILLSLYNKATKTYSIISPQVLPIENPVYSDPDGKTNIVLPYGRYKAEISGLGYKPEEIEFEIDPYKGGYPAVYLQPQPFNVINTLKYYFHTFLDTVSVSQDYLKEHSYSNRLLDLVTFLTLLIFLIVTFMSFSAKTHVSLLYLPYFLIYKTKLLFGKHGPNLIIGKVIDLDTGTPVSKAIVNLINVSKNQTVATVKTNKLGEFYLENKENGNYKIAIEKEGFTSFSSAEYDKLNNKVFTIFSIKKGDGQQYSPFDVLFIYSENFLGTLLEFLIIAGILFEIYFIFTFGFLRIAPFLILSLISLASLFLFVYKPRALK